MIMIVISIYGFQQLPPTTTNYVLVDSCHVLYSTAETYMKCS